MYVYTNRISTAVYRWFTDQICLQPTVYEIHLTCGKKLTDYLLMCTLDIFLCIYEVWMIYLNRLAFCIKYFCNR